MGTLRLVTHALPYVFLGLPFAASDPHARRCEKPLHSGSSSSLLQVTSSKEVGQTATQQVPISTASREFHEGQYGLNRVVGKDGVLMISFSDKAVRFKNSSAKLAKAGIRTTLFPMTDGHDTSLSNSYLGMALNTSCGFNCTCHVPGSPHARAIQALADSHRRALLFAQQRDSTWTAILEDDAVPVRSLPPNFSAEFEEIWSKVPNEARIVRLSYCFAKQSAEDGNWTVPTVARVATLRLTQFPAWRLQWYQPGMCTTGYMVHKEFIPEMLTWFPVACVLDGAYTWRFRHQWVFNIEQTRMSEQDWDEDGWMVQLGIMRQDWRTYKTGTTAGDRVNGEEKLNLIESLMR